MKVIVTPQQAAVLVRIEGAATPRGSLRATADLATQTTMLTGEIERVLDTLETFGFIARGQDCYRDILLRSTSIRVPLSDPFVAELSRRGYLVRRTFLP